MKMPGNMNMQAMMKQAQQMQEKLAQEVALIRVEGSAGGGMVTIKMDGHKNVLGVIIDRVARIGHADSVRVEKTGAAGEHSDVVPRELRESDVYFGLDHVLDAEGQIGHRDLVLDPIVDHLLFAVRTNYHQDRRFPVLCRLADLDVRLLAVVKDPNGPDAVVSTLQPIVEKHRVNRIWGELGDPGGSPGCGS